MKEIKLNSVIFILIKNSLVPVKVIEKLIRITSNGKHEKHLCQLFNKDKMELRDFILEDLNTKFFTNLEEAEEFLLQEAKKQISKVLNDAIIMKNTYFKDTIDNVQSLKKDEKDEDKNDLDFLNNQIQEEEKEEEFIIQKTQLEDGTIANFKIPKMLLKNS